MQLSSLCRGWSAAGALVTILLAHVGANAEPSSEAGGIAKAVSQLYGRYAWVVVFSTSPPSGAVPLVQASRRELLDVFAPDLAQAIWADAQCAEKRRETCTLDFDILFDSQDPSAYELKVQAGPRGGEALACFTDISGIRKCLTFIGVRVDGTAKVADIVYPGQRSLRHLLGLPRKGPG